MTIDNGCINCCYRDTHAYELPCVSCHYDFDTKSWTNFADKGTTTDTASGP